MFNALAQRLRNSFTELRYGSLSTMILELTEQHALLLKQLEVQWDRNRLLSELLKKDEAAQRKASDEINTRILKDMQENPEKYRSKESF